MCIGFVTRSIWITVVLVLSASHVLAQTDPHATHPAGEWVPREILERPPPSMRSSIRGKPSQEASTQGLRSRSELRAERMCLA